MESRARTMQNGNSGQPNGGYKMESRVRTPKILSKSGKQNFGRVFRLFLEPKTWCLLKLLNPANSVSSITCPKVIHGFLLRRSPRMYVLRAASLSIELQVRRPVPRGTGAQFQYRRGPSWYQLACEGAAISAA